MKKENPETFKCVRKTIIKTYIGMGLIVAGFQVFLKFI